MRVELIAGLSVGACQLCYLGQFLQTYALCAAEQFLAGVGWGGGAGQASTYLATS